MTRLLLFLVLVDIIVRVFTYSPCTTYEPTVRIYKDGAKVESFKIDKWECTKGRRMK
jgi:hypothetical protein